MTIRVVLVLVLLTTSAFAQRTRTAPTAQRTKTGYRAAIDMGSSGIKMIVTNSRGRTVHDEKIDASLGKGIGSDRLLPRKNQQVAKSALSTLIRRAAKFGVKPEEIDLVATAATRNADGKVTAAARKEGKRTGAQFIARDVRKGLGLVRAQILSGHEEATLGFKGAMAGVKDGGRYVVIDTGGGSHQLVVGQGDKIETAGSTQVGSNFVSEKILVDAHGSPLGRMSARDLANVDKRMAEAVPALPISASATHGATPLLTGGTSKYLRAHFGKTTVTRAEIEQLRKKVTSVEVGDAREALVRKDASGKAFSKREITRLGFHEDGGKNGGAYSTKLPAKLTLVLRVMTLLGAQSVTLSETDARHALALEPR